MKICPSCNFSNTDNYPTCIWCNEPIYAIESTPAADPDHPENVEKARKDARREIFWQQELFACGSYVVAVPLFALIIQVAPVWWVYLLYAASAAGVAAWLRVKPGSVALPALAQAGASTLILMTFGGGNIVMFFMIAVHAFLPMLLSMWLQMIEDVNR